MKKKILLVLILFTNFMNIWSQSNLKIPVIELGSNLQPYYDLISEIYSRMDITVEFVEVPSKRGFIAANQGEYDGLPMRIEGIEKVYTNLIPVGVPLSENKLYAYTKTGNLSIKSIDDLKNKTIVIVRGRQAAFDFTNDLSPFIINTEDQALKFLLSDRANVYIDFEIIVDKNIENLGLSELISKNEPPLLVIRLYHYLHKKHNSLIPEVSRILNAMKNDGSMAKILNQ